MWRRSPAIESSLFRDNFRNFGNRPSVSRSRRPLMPVRTKVCDGEDIGIALRRLSNLVRLAYAQSWTKRRYGYYEKPSVLRRKSRKLRGRNAQAGGALRLPLGLS